MADSLYTGRDLRRRKGQIRHFIDWRKMDLEPPCFSYRRMGKRYGRHG